MTSLLSEMVSISTYFRHKYIPNVPILQKVLGKLSRQGDKKCPDMLQNINLICYNKAVKASCLIGM